MAVQVEQQTDEEFAGNGSTVEFNMSHSVPPVIVSGLLLVLVSWLNDDLEDISSITWDPDGADEPLTEIASYQAADDSRVKAYYFIGPTIGLDNDIEVIFSAAPLSGSSIVVDAYSLSGVHQTEPIRDYDGEGHDTSATITAVLDAAVDGDFIASCNVIENPTTGDFDSSTISMTITFSGGAEAGVEHLHGYGGADGAGETIVCTWGTADHTAGMAVAIAQAVGDTYKIEGVTKNLAGAALGSCHCFLVKHTGGAMTFIDYVLSNASTGAYSFTGIVDEDPNYLVIAWKDDAPHVFDATDYVLTPVIE
jgi:hypothetical protein